ncbi:hypothetical protein LXA43DRAFT_1102108 [Ganoderma leucocontextum]|nr:hypothetical protein LXA43DRAFT_1102108 [Ganoderma leucocontextum]
MCPVSSEVATAADSASLLNKVMDGTADHTESSATVAPSLPIEVVQLIMDQLYNGSTPQDHCYRNQLTYQHWSLVCHSWRLYAQTLLFRIVEVTNLACLRRFAAVLDSAPHLASCIRLLRVYSRHLHTPENVFGRLPVILHNRLTSLRELAVTRISEDDLWHPHALSPPLPSELSHMPLPSQFFDALPVLRNVTVVKMYWVIFEGFGAFARTIHALANLRSLVCIQVHWRYLDELPPFMIPSQTAAGDPFLPELQDLTVSFLDIHGTERLLSALQGSSITRLFIDCPTYHSTAITPFNPSTDPFTGFGIGADLRDFPHLQVLSVSIPYTLAIFPGLPDAFASVLRSWTPRACQGTRTRTLMITPTYEYDFTREEFVDVLRALGPVTEDVFLDVNFRAAHDRSSQDHPLQDRDGADSDVVVVDVCVINKEEHRRERWCEVARECFLRMHEHGRLRTTFLKEYWDYWEWKDPAAEATTGEVTPDAGIEDELPPDEPALPDEADGEHPGPGYAPDVEEAARVVDGGSTQTSRKAGWKKQLNRPFRALGTFQRMLAGVRVRLKLGKLMTVVAARPQKG